MEPAPIPIPASSPVSRALSLLDVVAEHGGPARFVEIQKASGLPKGTLHRLLKQLEAERMLVFDTNSQRYRLGLRLIRLAHAAWEGATLVDAARPALDDLAADLGTTLHLACLEDGQVLYLDKRMPRPSVRMYAAPGRIGPAYCTGVGKAMLAQLEGAERQRAIARQTFVRHTRKTLLTPAALERALVEITKRGYALDDEEHEPNIICVAAPIVARNGVLLGALSATSTTHVTSLRALEGHAATILAAAERIARAAEMQLLNH